MDIGGRSTMVSRVNRYRQGMFFVSSQFLLFEFIWFLILLLLVFMVSSNASAFHFSRCVIETSKMYFHIYINIPEVKKTLIYIYNY